jgi:hypothetical protein
MKRIFRYSVLFTFLITSQIFNEVGFLFQLYGRNLNTDVTFEPNLYLVFGITF